MLSYKYSARDANTGQVIKSQVEAMSEQAAAKLIRDQGYTPISIEPMGGGKSIIPKRGRVKAKDKVLFSRQLSTLINAGLPLVQSLQNVMTQTQNKYFRVVISKIISDVEGGSAFSAAIAKHPAVFNEIYRSMVEAGEASGTLDRSLERLALQQEKDADMMRKIKGAFTYPIIVLFVMIGVCVYMMMTLLPQVEILYDGTGQSLPFTTALLLAVADFIKEFWYIVVILIGAGVFFTSKWARSGPGKEVIDKAKMKMPAIGTLFMKVYMARFTRTASILVESGVPLLQVLKITESAVDNVHIARSISAATEKVKGGRSLAESLKGDPNFLDLVPGMIGIGEQSGATEQMMAKTADYFEKEVDEAIKSISTIIEPVMMIFMGIIALVIVGAILLPVYTMSTDNIAQIVLPVENAIAFVMTTL